MYGLQKDSKLKEIIVQKDEDTAIEYRVVKKTIDLGSLKDDLEGLEAMVEPSDKEVLELAKQGMVHHYYESDKDIKISELEEEIAKWQ